MRDKNIDQKRIRGKFLDHDFPIKGQGKVALYGTYLVNNNEGFVNLGRDHDTSKFAVESIRKWWDIVGKHTFPQAKKNLYKL